MPTASLAGHSLTSCLLSLPSQGILFADVVTEDAAALPLGSSVTLILAGLTISTRVFRGEVYQGAGHYRIEGGTGGWRRGIQARSHQDDSGVKLSRVLAAVISDMAAANQESLVDQPVTGGNVGLIPVGSEVILGDHWMRRAGIASGSLGLLTVPWYVRLDGATYCGARPTGAVQDAAYDVLDYDPGKRRVSIATETPEAWVPGLTFTDSRLSSPLLLREVTVVMDESSLRVEVMG